MALECLWPRGRLPRAVLLTCHSTALITVVHMTGTSGASGGAGLACMASSHKPGSAGEHLHRQGPGAAEMGGPRLWTPRKLLEIPQM